MISTFVEILLKPGKVMQLLLYFAETKEQVKSGTTDGHR
jgi:hypothetical protein